MAQAAFTGGKLNNEEMDVYRGSIQASKQTIVRDTLGVFYRDAKEFYDQGRYDEALEILDKIASIDPYYEDVSTLRETIRTMKTSKDRQTQRDAAGDYYRKGVDAEEAGNLVKAISYWKKALAIAPGYKRAQIQIQLAHKRLAQRELEKGYLQYHQGAQEDALESWSNAIALDPSLKKHGLLALTSKVELALQRDKLSKLASQAYTQYQQKEYTAALTSYEELIRLQPRNDEARRMAAKIRLLLGREAFEAARNALVQKQYAEAIRQWERSIAFGYEGERAQKEIENTEKIIQTALLPKPAPKEEPPEKEEPEPKKEEAPAVSMPPANPQEAMEHYRQGLAAFQSRDYHHAVQELKTAWQLDPSNERIYIALQRAEKEWSSASGNTSGALGGKPQ